MAAFKKGDKCEWRILATHGEKIILNITSLDIPESPNCQHDYLEVRKLYNSNTNLACRVCYKFETMLGYHVSNLLTKDNQKSNEFPTVCIHLMGALLHNGRVTVCLRCLLSKIEKSYKIVCTPV